MTGRKGRVVSSKDGSVTYESRSERDVPLELLNIAEKKRFMEGEKVMHPRSRLRWVLILIFSVVQFSKTALQMSLFIAPCASIYCAISSR